MTLHMRSLSTLVLLLAALSLVFGATSSVALAPHNPALAAGPATATTPNAGLTYTYDTVAVNSSLAAERIAVVSSTEASDRERIVGATGDLSRLASSFVAAETVSAALPAALAGGETNTYVYIGVRDGKQVYTGITNNIARRGAEHGERFDQLRQVTSTPVTRGQARSIEQALISRNPGFENKINSISPNRPYYQDAVDWGNAWLSANGYP